MFYDYYYEVNGTIKRYTTDSQLSDEQVTSLFGTKKKVVTLQPMLFEREDQKVHAGYIGYIQ